MTDQNISKIDAEKTLGVYPFIKTYASIDTNYSEWLRDLNEIITNGNIVHPTFIKDKFRPLKYKETIEAMVNDYETIIKPDGKIRSDNERTNLFNKSLTTCTSICTKAHSTKFKINLLCEKLLLTERHTYDPNSSHNDEFASKIGNVDYDEFTGVEFDLSEELFNSKINKNNFTNHKIYRFLYVDDITLMNTYFNIRHALMSYRSDEEKKELKESLRGFYIHQTKNRDTYNLLHVGEPASYFETKAEQISSCYGYGLNSIIISQQRTYQM